MSELREAPTMTWAHDDLIRKAAKVGTFGSDDHNLSDYESCGCRDLEGHVSYLRMSRKQARQAHAAAGQLCAELDFCIDASTQ